MLVCVFWLLQDMTRLAVAVDITMRQSLGISGIARGMLAIGVVFWKWKTALSENLNTANSKRTGGKLTASFPSKKSMHASAHWTSLLQLHKWQKRILLCISLSKHSSLHCKPILCLHHRKKQLTNKIIFYSSYDDAQSGEFVKQRALTNTPEEGTDRTSAESVLVSSVSCLQLPLKTSFVPHDCNYAATAL